MPNQELEHNGKEAAQSPERKDAPKKQKRSFLTVIIILLLVTGGLYIFRDSLRGTKLGALIGLEAPAQAKEVYYCPMHPNYKSDKPGDCPICNMALVKLEPTADAGAREGHTETPMADNMPPGSIKISPQKQQIIGVQYGEVLYKPLSRTIRTVGRIAFDETKVSHIHTKVTGYIEHVFVDYVGKSVRKGDPLFTIYSPELVSTQEEYLLALRASRLLGNNPFQEISAGSRSLLEAARKRLELWDITDDEIETLEREGKTQRTLSIYSPVSGIVTDRAAYHHGRFVNPEMDLYTIVDLSTIWIIGEVYEYELPFVKLGQTVEIEFPYSNAQTALRGKIAFVYPSLDPKTRTGQIRVEFPNPNLDLKPDMFVNVIVKVDLGRQLVIPLEAVLDSGAEQIVFVAREGGYFEPRKVRLGAKVYDQYIVLNGLKAGERIVTSGNFLIDSESQLKSAMGAMAGMEHGGTETPKQQPSGQPPHSGHRP
jgi:RND family efflux transporter MFP subunit